MKYITLIVTLVFLQMPSCHIIPDLVEEMEYLDSAYIPLWYAVEQEDMYTAQRAFIVYNHRWNQFSTKFSQLSDEHKSWNTSIQKIVDYQKQLSIAINCNDIYDSSNQLGNVQSILRSISHEYKVPYFLDHLWDFHLAYKEVEKVVNDPMLHLYEWREFETIVECMNDQWKILKRQAPSKALIDWEVEVIANYVQKRHALNIHIQEFNNTVECAELEQVMMSCEDLRPGVIQLIAVFGDFESSKTHYALK